MNVEIAILIIVGTFLFNGVVYTIAGTFRLDKPERTPTYGPAEALVGLVYLALGLAVWFL